MCFFVVFYTNQSSLSKNSDDKTADLSIIASLYAYKYLYRHYRERSTDNKICICVAAEKTFEQFRVNLIFEIPVLRFSDHSKPFFKEFSVERNQSIIIEKSKMVMFLEINNFQILQILSQRVCFCHDIFISFIRCFT